jgi:hypothetical protein
MEEYYFLSFDSTNYALKAENFLKTKNCSITIMPTPREVSASCGLSIKINDGDLEFTKRTILEGSLKVKGVYKLHRVDGKRGIEKVWEQD